MRLNAPIAPLALALLAAALPPFALAQKVENQVVHVSKEDATMNRAMAKARATLDEFLRTAANPPEGTSNFRLKVRVSDEHGVEHVWVSPFQVLDGQRFEGVITNRTRTVEVVDFGDTHRFSRADVSDWGYVQNGRQMGSFTVCALFEHMPPEQVQRYKQDHGFVCAD